MVPADKKGLILCHVLMKTVLFVIIRIIVYKRSEMYTIEDFLEQIVTYA